MGRTRAEGHTSQSVYSGVGARYSPVVSYLPPDDETLSLSLSPPLSLIRDNFRPVFLDATAFSTLDIMLPEPTQLSVCPRVESLSPLCHHTKGRPDITCGRPDHAAKDSHNTPFLRTRARWRGRREVIRHDQGEVRAAVGTHQKHNPPCHHLHHKSRHHKRTKW
jgi:hypothetical protein